MALSRIEGDDELYVGGIWALRRSDKLADLNIKHVVTLAAFNPDNLKNFMDEPWTEYGKHFRQLVIDIDDVDDADLLAELPRAVRFIDEGLNGTGAAEKTDEGEGVFIHCAAGKSRSVSTTIAYLLWRYPERFDPGTGRNRRDTAEAAVNAALALIRRTRPMAEPNDGFMEQLHLWWIMGCPEDDIEAHPGYQRWAYKREVEENVAVGQAPSRLRFEDEAAALPGGGEEEQGREEAVSLRCKMCRRTLATTPFIAVHKPGGNPRRTSAAHSSKSSRGHNPLSCPHYIEPLSWMRGELEKAQLSGRLGCPGPRCGASVGRYDWKGLRCGCGQWVTPAFSLQRGRVDEEKDTENGGFAGGKVGGGMDEKRRALGIRMPPGRGGNL